MMRTLPGSSGREFVARIKIKRKYDGLDLRCPTIAYYAEYETKTPLSRASQVWLADGERFMRQEFREDDSCIRSDIFDYVQGTVFSMRVSSETAQKMGDCNLWNWMFVSDELASAYNFESEGSRLIGDFDCVGWVLPFQCGDAVKTVLWVQRETGILVERIDFLPACPATASCQPHERTVTCTLIELRLEKPNRLLFSIPSYFTIKEMPMS